MQVYVTLLRGINVSGQKLIKMEQLREIFVGMGFEDVRSYIQTGNLVFGSAESAGKLEVKIEKVLKKAYGYEVRAVVRSQKQIGKVIKKMPFKSVDTKRVFVIFLREKPKDVPVKELDAAKKEGEEYKILGKEVYFYCPGNMGRTKLSNNFFEKKLGVVATTRNWRTVNKLAEM